MTGLDWLIAIVFILSIVVGVLRGFIREVLSIVSWILAFWLSITFCAQAGNFVAQYVNIPAEAFRISAGFALIFIATLFLFSIISYIVTKLIVKRAIKGTDRILGLFFGATRAVAIVIVVLLLGRGIGLDSKDWWQSSMSLSYFEPLADYVEELLPSQLQASEPEIDSSLIKSDNISCLNSVDCRLKRIKYVT